MTRKVRKEVEELIKGYDIESNMSAEDLRDNSPIDGSWPHWWIDISRKHSFSEDFIVEFKNKLGWSNVSRYQKLSFNFIVEMDDYIKMDYLLKNKNFSMDRFKEYKETQKIHSRFEIMEL